MIPKLILRIVFAGPIFFLSLSLFLVDAAGAQPTELDPGAGVEDSGGIPDPEPPGEEYDPWDGIDRNGRIPKADFPNDIKHPDRWRYIPEGRIKPGNPFQRFLVSSFIAPFVFSNGDVGTGFGVAFTDIDFRLQRRREIAGLFMSYTTKGQQRYGLSWRRMLKTRDLPGGGGRHPRGAQLRLYPGSVQQNPDSSLFRLRRRTPWSRMRVAIWMRR